MRDRLIELVCENIQDECVSHCNRPYCDKCKNLADYLLANGVIIPPCKVGDVVYVPWHWEGQEGVANIRVEEIKFYDSQMHYMFLLEMESDDESFNQSFGGWKLDECIGKTVFLTKEEADKALISKWE